MLTAAIDILQAELKKAKQGEDTMPHILSAMNRYATLACEEQRRSCYQNANAFFSDYEEKEIEIDPSSILYAPLPTLK